jgi:hypothetical protein
MSTEAPPPGWYKESGVAGRAHYWDGTRWTDRRDETPSQGSGSTTDRRDEHLEAQIMLDESRRSLDSQRADLNNVKARASTLLGVSGLILPLASALAINDMDQAFIILALMAFLAAVAYAAYVLWPHKLTFEIPTDLLIEARDRAESTEHYLRSVAATLGSYREVNIPMMRSLTGAYMATGLFVGLEIVALALGAVLG